MGVYSLEKSECNPKVHGENVQVVPGEAVEEGSSDRALSENQDLERVGVFSGLRKKGNQLQIIATQ